MALSMLGFLIASVAYGSTLGGVRAALCAIAVAIVYHASARGPHA
jgi:hypothetical protein